MLIEFSDCVLSGRDHQQACGEDGLADVRIIEALLCSAQTGQPVKLGPLAHARGSERVSES